MSKNKRHLIGAYYDKDNKLRPITAPVGRRRGISTGIPMRSKGPNRLEFEISHNDLDEAMTIDGVTKTRGEWLDSIPQNVDPRIGETRRKYGIPDNVDLYLVDGKVSLTQYMYRNPNRYEPPPRWLDVFFPVKPDKKILKELRGSGFNWDPEEQVWSARKTPEREEFLEHLKKKSAVDMEVIEIKDWSEMTPDERVDVQRRREERIRRIKEDNQRWLDTPQVSKSALSLLAGVNMNKHDKKVYESMWVQIYGTPPGKAKRLSPKQEEYIIKITEKYKGQLDKRYEKEKKHVDNAWLRDYRAVFEFFPLQMRGKSIDEAKEHLVKKTTGYADKDKVDLSGVKVNFDPYSNSLAQVHGRASLSGPPVNPWILEDLEIIFNPGIYEAYHKHIPDTIEKYSDYVIAHELEHVRQWKEKGPAWVRVNEDKMEDLAQKEAMRKTGLTPSDVKKLGRELEEFSRNNPDKIPPEYRARGGYLISEEYYNE